MVQQTDFPRAKFVKNEVNVGTVPIVYNCRYQINTPDVDHVPFIPCISDIYHKMLYNTPISHGVQLHVHHEVNIEIFISH